MKSCLSADRGVTAHAIEPHFAIDRIRNQAHHSEVQRSRGEPDIFDGQRGIGIAELDGAQIRQADSVDTRFDCNASLARTSQRTWPRRSGRNFSKEIEARGNLM